MCENDLKLSVLPDVLQDIVIMYAYNLPKDVVLRSLHTILDIKDMQLPFFFFKQQIWSWHYKTFLPNPVFSFMPIEYYSGRYNVLFDDDAMYCLLIGLDFRRRDVRLFGSRDAWMNRICSSWRAVEPLAAYYKMLLRTKQQIMKKRGPLIMNFI